MVECAWYVAVLSWCLPCTLSLRLRSASGKPCEHEHQHGSTQKQLWLMRILLTTNFKEKTSSLKYVCSLWLKLARVCQVNFAWLGKLVGPPSSSTWSVIRTSWAGGGGLETNRSLCKSVGLRTEGFGSLFQIRASWRVSSWLFTSLVGFGVWQK